MKAPLSIRVFRRAALNCRFYAGPTECLNASILSDWRSPSIHGNPQKTQLTHFPGHTFRRLIPPLFPGLPSARQRPASPFWSIDKRVCNSVDCNWVNAKLFVPGSGLRKCRPVLKGEHWFAVRTDLWGADWSRCSPVARRYASPSQVLIGAFFVAMLCISIPLLVVSMSFVPGFE